MKARLEEIGAQEGVCPEGLHNVSGPSSLFSFWLAGDEQVSLPQLPFHLVLSFHRPRNNTAKWQ